MSELLVQLFQLSDPREARGGQITAREILRRGTERIESAVTEEPLVRARTMTLLGTVHRNLEMYDDAERLFTAALETRADVLSDEHPDVADSLYHLGELHRARGEPEAAVPLLRRALTIREKLLGVDDPLVTETRAHLVELLRQSGRTEEAASLEKSARASR